MIKYLGSKRILIPHLCELVRDLEARSVIDLFSGTSRVGHALKRVGVQVHANDHNAYATTLARCYVVADHETWHADATRLVAEFNQLPGDPGYFTDTFCQRSRFFQPHNGARIDAIRAAIAAKGLAPELEAVLLVSLMEAADRVDSTVGVQMAYLKKWAPRSYNQLELRVPELLPRAEHGHGTAHQLDALVAATELSADLAYLDPPYNQHKYVGNYHIWESLVLWDKPETYGTACKRVDCRTRVSPFNSKVSAVDALAAVVAEVKARHLIVSFNDEGHINRATMEDILRDRGEVLVLANDFRRYIGAQVGIFNPKGDKVGQVGRLRNTEYLYVVSDSPAALQRARQRWHDTNAAAAAVAS